MSLSGAPSWMVVGHLNKAHGTKGELFVWPLTDYPGSHFAPGVVLFVGEDPEGASGAGRKSGARSAVGHAAAGGTGASGTPLTAMEPARGGLQLEVETVRAFRKGFLVKFDGVDSRTQAEELKDLYLIRPFDEMDELDEGEVYYHDLVGAAVVTVGGDAVGTVSEVYPLKPADLLDVTGPEGSVMIPFIPEIVVSVDREAKRVVIDPPEGLLDP